MNCKTCSGEVVDQAKFCSYCGERVAVACLSCGVLNTPDGLFCRECGRSLTGEGESPSLGGQQPRSSALSCPRCHTANEPGSTYCYQCGLPLEDERQAHAYAYVPGGHVTVPYKSPRLRANWTVGLLIATCIAYLIFILVTFNLLNLVSRMEGGEAILTPEMNEALDGLDGVDILLFLTGLPTAVLFLMWVHRISRNLAPLGAHGQRFSPAWAVGWWLVPIMFYFRPYQVMCEIWKGSAHHSLEATVQDWKSASVTPLMGWWWGLWVATSVVGLVFGYGLGFEMIFRPDTYPDAVGLSVDLIVAAATICDGVLAIMLVRQITNLQDEKYH